MLQWLKSRSNRTAIARQLYGSSVAAARDVVFYRDWRVADTIEGRFEMVVLHVALLLRRLSGDGEAARRLGQAVLEEMFATLDDDMRELGVGDMSVPRRVQGAASAFYGRLRVYDAALQGAHGGALGEAIARNLPAAGAVPVAAEALAAYALQVAADLTQQPFEALQRGEVTYPSPGPNERSPAS